MLLPVVESGKTRSRPKSAAICKIYPQRGRLCDFYDATRGNFRSQVLSPFLAITIDDRASTRYAHTETVAHNG